MAEARESADELKIPGADTGVAGLGRTLEMHFADYLKTGPMLGLMAQLGFASFPLLQLR
jgi:hypothetical protein